MTENYSPANRSRMLTDEQTERLLVSFFHREMPADLKDPAPRWNPRPVPQRKASRPSLQRVGSESEMAPPTRKSSPRAILAVLTTLATCLLLAVVGGQSTGPAPSNQSGTPAVANAAESGAQEDDSANDADPDQLMNVSTSPDGEITLDDADTTIQEIDQIDLSPSRQPRENQQPK